MEHHHIAAIWLAMAPAFDVLLWARFLGWLR
jgi:hypothetical protein